MIDADRVIRGLQDIKTYLASQAEEAEKAGNDLAKEGHIESQKDIIDAIALIKCGQPTKPEIFINNCYCGKCDDYIMSAKQARTPIYRKKARFCCHCGQPIDWQELEQGGEQE